MRTARILTTVIVACFAGQHPSSAAPSERDLRLRVTPTVIQMGALYSGAHVRVEGVVRPGSKVAVVIRGQSKPEVFNRKVQRGPIWINSGKTRVSGVPTLFLRFSDGMLRHFLSREELDLYQLDQAAIQRQMEIEPDQDHDTMVASWLTLKAADGTYALVRDGVKMGAPRADGVPFTVQLWWPRKAAPGNYQLSAYECRDRVVASHSSVHLSVTKVGFPAWLADLARMRSLAYGLVAVLVAAAAGFGIDLLVALLFGRKVAAGH